MNETIKNLGHFFKNLFSKTFGKLDTISTLNAIIIIVAFLFVTIYSIGESVLTISYAIFGSIAQLIGKQITPTVDTTPFYQYALFLLIASLSCILIVKKHKNNELW